MAGEIIRPKDLTPRPAPVASELMVVDNNVNVGAATIKQIVEAGRPAASQAEAAAGTDATKAMTPLTTKQSIAAEVGASLASKAQGDKADSAVQPGALAAVATSGEYGDLAGKPMLGTAAAEDIGAFATAAQGGLAGTAVQPTDLAPVAVSNDYEDLNNQPTSRLLPPGGVTSQVLVKASDDDYNTQWETSFASTAVSYAEQTLNAGQQEQARENIGVGSRGHIDGLTLSNNSADATNDINVASGEAASDLSPINLLVLPSTITKRLDAAWSVGTGGGGLDTGSKAANKWYHVWLIKNLTTGAVDALFSLSATNPALPTGWTAKRRIGSIGTDGASVIRQFAQFGDSFTFSSGLVGPTSLPNNGAVIRNLDVPLGVKLNLSMMFNFRSPTVLTYFGAKDPDLGVITLGDCDVRSQVIGGDYLVPLQVFCNASGQVYTFGHAADTVLSTYYVRGWRDARGRAYHDGV